MTRFSIPVIEYESRRPGAVVTPPKKPFIVNDKQLVVAMVRSSLTANSGRASRKAVAAIVWPTVQFMLEWKSAPDLKLSTHFLQRFRDFSGTMRIGELAQGVSYAYWKWQRGYSWIADFGPWVSGLNPKYAGTKQPDFVMLNLATNDLAVMESKGARSNGHNPAMRKALLQCRDAIQHPAFSSGYGSVLTLAAGIPAHVGRLHIRDPKNITELDDKLMFYLFRRAYASWFDLAGDEELADFFRQDISDLTTLTIDRERLDRVGHEVSTPLSDMTALALGFNPSKTKYEIEPIVADAISNFESFKNTDWKRYSQKIESELADDQRSLRFPDGTLITEY